jgi:hypothetical protein
MKKLLSAALAFAFFLFCCGCNSAKPTVKEIKSALTESGAFSAEENLIALDTKEIEERFGFSTDILDDFSVLVSKTENEVEQFGVFTLKDNDDLNTVIDAIKQYLLNYPQTSIIFVTSRYVGLFDEIENRKFYILVGNEAKRLSRTLSGSRYNGKCILAPYPRTMGTEVPNFAENSTFELEKIDFTSSFRDSCTAVGLQLALELGASEILCVGYDGYVGQVLSDKEIALTMENRILFEDFKAHAQKVVISLLPTRYDNLMVNSIYQYL